MSRIGYPVDELSRAIHLVTEFTLREIAQLVEIEPRPGSIADDPSLSGFGGGGRRARACDLVLVNLDSDDRQS